MSLVQRVIAETFPNGLPPIDRNWRPSPAALELIREGLALFSPLPDPQTETELETEFSLSFYEPETAA